MSQCHTRGGTVTDASRSAIYEASVLTASKLPEAQAPLFASLPHGVSGRLDRALASAEPVAAASVSRERLKALMASGAVTLEGVAATDPSAPARPGLYRIDVPQVEESRVEAQDLPLTVLFEDAHLIVIDKAAGMAAHPAPGTPDGTLVNALLHHGAGSLSGVGGVARPGIVHRLDKDTSGVIVAAKTDAAHHGLAALFERHDIERAYVALLRGAPDPARGVVHGRIGRSHHDRQKMAVLRTGGREAITHYRVERTFGPALRPLASRVECRLETGRTHQIRVHMASKGSPVLGDATYGSGSPAKTVREAMEAAGLVRQALHARLLGFVHPITGEALRFETPPPADMQALEAALAAL